MALAACRFPQFDFFGPASPNSTASLPAPGVFTDSINSTGWAVLDVHTSASFDDAVQVYAAGYAEGVVTQARSWQYYANSFAGLEYDGTPLGSYLTTNLLWMQSQVDANPTDPFWHQVGLLLVQQSALYEGYSSVAPAAQRLSALQLQSASLSGDLDDLCVPDLFNCTKVALGRGLQSSKSHCSLLVKPVVDAATGKPADLLFAHTTWSGFETMTRVYKRYDFPLSVDGTAGGAQVPAVSISFSSYPAALYSDDDWLQTSVGLTVSGVPGPAAVGWHAPCSPL
jgi:hypothetical protein